MKQITKDAVIAETERLLPNGEKKPRRRCFADHPGVSKEKANPTFSVPIESAKKIIEAQTNLRLKWSREYDNYWCYLDRNGIEAAEEWERNQGTLIYLRDCLSLSIALDRNLVDNESGQYTPIGNLENKGKNHQDQQSINELAEIVSGKIQSLPYYKDADFICSVPPSPDKDFDLPSVVTDLVSTRISKKDVTGGFAFRGQKAPLKKLGIDEKWNALEKAGIFFESGSFDINDKAIVLIDDKYQSGTTIQYIAMKLQQAGAREVYGLSFVKTLGDRNNIGGAH